MKYPILAAAIAALTLSACEKTVNNPPPVVETPAPAAVAVPVPVPVPVPGPKGEPGAPGAQGAPGAAGPEGKPGDTVIVAPAEPAK
ncbi:MAG: collagen-like protein [Pseudomonadota bacterium]